MATGLFDIDVLARIEGHDRHGGVPVVGRSDDDGIYGLVVEKAPEVLFATGFLRPLIDDGLLPLLDRARIHIPDTNYPAVLRLGKRTG